MNEARYIIGAGMTGLSAGLHSGYPILEAASAPGGICASYYLRAGDSTRLLTAPADGEAYRFEFGGGHWIFGGDEGVIALIERFAPVRRYARRSSVYLPGIDRLVPYPIQYHLHHVPEPDARAVLRELEAGAAIEAPVTMADAMAGFGPTLHRLFFAPFQEAYTAGLWHCIAPQDGYKTPIDLALVHLGAAGAAPATGYNAEFIYPENGLDRLASGMAAGCDVRYGSRLVGVDPVGRTLRFADGSESDYERVWSTIPLNQMAAMAGVTVGERPDPHTAVLVLNIGARRGPRMPAEHWVYVPKSTSGFHRVGFYDQVDAQFLPASVRGRGTHASLYVERAFLPDERPDDTTIADYVRSAIAELTDWGYIGEAEVVDTTWIEVAYTWQWPGSTWRERTLQALDDVGITMIGRYGRWHFQGIAASIREGMAVR